MIIRGLLIDCVVHHFIDIEPSNVDFILAVIKNAFAEHTVAMTCGSENLFDRPFELWYKNKLSKITFTECF